MNTLKISLCFLLAFSLSGCANNNETSGQIIGGIAGATIGSQFGKGDGQIASTAIGAIAGSMIGGQIGADLDERDRLEQQRAFSNATSAPLGTNIHWRNINSGHHGSVTPIKEGYNEQGHYCRGVSQTIIVDNKEYHRYSKVCQYDHNNWYLVD